jgi:glycosyltransferase involved in cell wall biosynthesis
MNESAPVSPMRSYIVIVSPSYGGAEKRFFDIFSGLRSLGVDVHLIAPSSLVAQLRQDHPERAWLFEAIVPVALDAWSRVGFVLEFRKMLRTLPRGGRFHYPLNCLWFLHAGRGDKVSMSVADCVRVPGPFGGTHTSVLTWIAFFFVTRIDVLSPAILASMQRYRMAPRMTLTPGGTYLVPSAGAIVAKRPVVAFLGRLVPLKGIDDFMDVLPDVYARLRDRVPADFSFEIAGYGPLESHVVDRVAALVRSGVPIRFVGYVVAEKIMSYAAVLVSMQEITNYPSRVVAEALVAGCGVVVRDTGDSREFGTDLPGLLYCKAALDSVELADILAGLTVRGAEDLAHLQTASDVASRRFSSEGYIAYFKDILHQGTP